MTEDKKKFLQIIEDDSYGLCPAPMSADLAINVLVDYLLGEDFYIVTSMSREQAYTELVATILEKYSKAYRKDIKLLIKKGGAE